MSHELIRCPYCGKKVGVHERYCFTCEQDISKVIDKAQKPDKH
ncbi:hypothetical protein ACFLZX_06050 [Nanoarchaeota archaeon]